MSPAKHAAVSAVTGLTFFYLTKSAPGALVCFLSGVLIDLDHLLDFYLGRKKICRKFSEMEDFCLNEEGGKLYLILHSYELMIALWLMGIVFYLPLVWFGLAVGMSVHLLFDQFTNPTYPFAYFWFVRCRFGFTRKIFFYQQFMAELERIKK